MATKTKVTVKRFSADPHVTQPEEDVYIVPGLPKDVARFQSTTLEHLYNTGTLPRQRLKLNSDDETKPELYVFDETSGLLAIQLSFRVHYE